MGRAGLLPLATLLLLFGCPEGDDDAGDDDAGDDDAGDDDAANPHANLAIVQVPACLLYTSPSPRDHG